MKKNKALSIAYYPWTIFWSVILITASLLLCSKSQISAGGGSDTEVCGRLLTQAGQGAAGAIAVLIDTSYDPALDDALPETSYDTADIEGSYRFGNVRPGVYNIWAQSCCGDERALIGNIVAVEKQQTQVEEAVLAPTALIRFVLPDSLSGVNGVVFIPGTPLTDEITGVDAVAEIRGVPVAVFPSMRFRRSGSDRASELMSGIEVIAADTITLNAVNEIWGRVTDAKGISIQGASVTLIPSDYNPLSNKAIANRLHAATGQDGVFRMFNIEEGAYNLYAAMGGKEKKFISGVSVDTQKSINIGNVTTKESATLVVVMPDSLVGIDGYVYLQGTLLIVNREASALSVRFDSIAQGNYASIIFQRGEGEKPAVLYTDIRIDSAGLFTLHPFSKWHHEALVSFNTRPEGAAIEETLFDFPALIRLNGEGLNFSEAKSEGEDLRFVKMDYSSIPFEIEYWDSATSSAVVWVKLDTVIGSCASQTIRMFWGNPFAKKVSRPSAVFDTATGFQGVWHLGESGPDRKLDATANGFNATPVGLTGSSDVGGIAGRALDLDGSSQCLTVLNARNSRLDVQKDSFFTVSAWVYLRNTQRDNRVIVSKGSGQYGLLANGKNQWEFYAGLYGYGVDTTTAFPLSVNEWTLLTGVRSGMRQYLYVNGIPVDSTVSAAGVNAGISGNFYDLVIGRQSDDESQWFDGTIDEVRVENRARKAAWIRLCYENQRSDQKFVTIRQIK